MAQRRAGKGEKKSGGSVPALELRQHLGQDATSRAWLVLGPEGWLRQEALAALEEAFLQGGGERVDLDGNKVSLAAVLDEVRARPFFGAGRRLIVVRDAGSAGQKGGFAGDHGEALAQFLSASTSPSVLVLEAQKTNGRFKGTKALEKALVTVACDAPDESGLLSFVRARARAGKRELGRGAAEALLERLGGHDIPLAQIDAEVQKLCAAGQGPITPEEVAALCSVGSSEESFGLVDCVGRGDVGEGLLRLQAIFRDGLVANGERNREPTGIAFMLLGMLRWDLGRLLRGRAMLERGCRPHAITSELRVFRDKDRFQRRLERATRDELGRRHELLRAADAALKASGDARATMTDVVVRLSRGEQSRAAGSPGNLSAAGRVRAPRRW